MVRVAPSELAHIGVAITVFLDTKAREYLGLEEHPIRDEDRLLMKIRIENIIDAGADLETD